jgi:hypothetical protein
VENLEVASPKSVRKWIIITTVFLAGLAGLLSWLALKTEKDVKESFERNLRRAMLDYQNYTDATGRPPASSAEFIAWLDKAYPPATEVQELIRSGRVEVVWGGRPAKDQSGSEQVLAYTTDPPVRGRRPVGMLDHTVRWMTPEEFDAAPKAEPER